MTDFDLHTFAGRMAPAERFEQIAADAARAEGWRVAKAGQGLYDESAREMLRRAPTKQMVRWFPDLVAHRGRHMIYIDAKNSAPHHNTLNHAIETDSLHSHESDLVSGVQVIYAFPHPRACTGPTDSGTDITVKWVRHAVFVDHAKPAPFMGVGSGTPFQVAPCLLCSSSIVDALSVAVTEQGELFS